MGPKQDDSNMALVGDDPQIGQPEMVMAKEFAAKFRAKYECYKFLVGDVKAYLPSYDDIDIYYMKAQIGGDKKCKYGCHLFLNQVLFEVLTNDEVRVFFVP